MSLLKVFVSSTCYDLNIVRNELRSYLQTLGHEPVMSDYNDILFDPRHHTHESCMKEIGNTDVVILIIGSRFGGNAIPKAINSLDLENLKMLSKGNKILETPEKISITQLEIFKAIESNIPIFTFIDSKVLHDHLFYEKNKDKKGFIDTVEFPSIDKKESAVYIFEFINFLRLRSKNNSIVDFSKLSDIEDYLKRQWSSLFQRLLFEQRSNKSESRRLEAFSEELKDIKSLILSSITAGQAKDVGRGVLRYRRLVEFILGFNHPNPSQLLMENITWQELIDKLDINEIIITETINKFRPNVYLIKTDGTFYELRLTISLFEKRGKEWAEFRQLPDLIKTEVIAALTENMSNVLLPVVRYHSEQFQDYLNEATSKDKTTATTINPNSLSNVNSGSSEEEE